MYAWLIKYFNDGNNEQRWSTKDAYRLVEQLITTIKQDDNESNELEEEDELGKFMDEIINLGVRKEYNELTEYEDINESIIEPIINEECEEDPGNMNYETNSDLHSLALCDIFQKGQDRMIEMYIPKIRQRKRKQLQRASKFMLDLFSDVMSNTFNIEEKIRNINNYKGNAGNYRIIYRQFVSR